VAETSASGWNRRAWRRIDWGNAARAPRRCSSGPARHFPRGRGALAFDAEQQLVEIACAIGAGARIVIMDEPTASLTSREQERLFIVVRELRASGVASSTFPTPRRNFHLADRVTVLRDGESVGSTPCAT